jgi:hypothetical protein
MVNLQRRVPVSKNPSEKIKALSPQSQAIPALVISVVVKSSKKYKVYYGLANKPQPEQSKQMQWRRCLVE